MTPPSTPVLCTVWCRSEPARVGSYLRPHDGVATIGRGSEPTHLPWLRHDEGVVQPAGPLHSERVSRTQLSVARHGAGVRLHNRGRRALMVAGRVVDQAVAEPGDLVVLQGEIAWQVQPRSAPHPAQRSFGLAHGQPDAGGFVGDAEPMWAMRFEVARHAQTRGVVGVAAAPGDRPVRVGRLLHRLSGRPGRARRFEPTDPTLPPYATCMVTRAQLGSAQARVGTRPDLVWVVLDARGDEGWPMVRVPPLDQRRSDVPLLLRHHLLQLSMEEPTELSRYLDDHGEVKISLELVEQLLQWPYQRGEEELEQLVWRSVTTSPRTRLAAVSRARNVRTASWESWGEEVDFEQDEQDL